MTDYISREAFLEHIRKGPLFDLVERYGLSNVIEWFPPADVVEVVHGEWRPGKEISRTMLGDETLAIEYDAFYCSSCGRRYKEYVLTYNYCPNCGAALGGDAP